jgi:hypothetical protein
MRPGKMEKGELLFLDDEWTTFCEEDLGPSSPKESFKRRQNDIGKSQNTINLNITHSNPQSTHELSPPLPPHLLPKVIFLNTPRP